jgi:hypothetical protein
MSIEKIPGNSGKQSLTGKKPFLSDFVEDHPGCEGFNYEIFLVKETASRAGYLLETKDFLVHVFKSSPLAEVLLSTIEDLYSNKHCALFVIIDPEEMDGICLAIDLEVKRTWVRTKKYPGGYRYEHAKPGAKRAKSPLQLL